MTTAKVSSILLGRRLSRRLYDRAYRASLAKATAWAGSPVDCLAAPPPPPVVILLRSQTTSEGRSVL